MFCLNNDILWGKGMEIMVKELVVRPHLITLFPNLPTAKLKITTFQYFIFKCIQEIQFERYRVLKQLHKKLQQRSNIELFNKNYYCLAAKTNPKICLPDTPTPPHPTPTQQCTIPNANHSTYYSVLINFF